MIAPGRDRRAEFADLWSKSLKARVVISLAFANLTSSAKSVCFIVFIKIDNARHHKRRHEDGRPIITFSAPEAKALLNISGVTHTAAMRQMVEHGFLDLIGHGGLLGANGTASKYAPSKRWQNWKPAVTKDNTVNIAKARQAKKSMNITQKVKPEKPPLEITWNNAPQFPVVC